MNDRDAAIERAIRELESSLIQMMNRVLACEALLYGFLEAAGPDVLEPLERKYDSALIRLAEQVEPSLQRPEFWQGFLIAIHELRELRKSGEGL